MRIFIGGIMQGSHQSNVMADQTYRQVISLALAQRWPEVEVLDPLRLHPDGLGYDDASARATLLAMLDLAHHSDLVIAYLPTASMGTALEIFTAERAGVPEQGVGQLGYPLASAASAERWNTGCGGVLSGGGSEAMSISASARSAGVKARVSMHHSTIVPLGSMV